MPRHKLVATQDVRLEPIAEELHGIDAYGDVSASQAAFEFRRLHNESIVLGLVRMIMRELVHEHEHFLIAKMARCVIDQLRESIADYDAASPAHHGFMQLVGEAQQSLMLPVDLRVLNRILITPPMVALSVGSRHRSALGQKKLGCDSPAQGGDQTADNNKSNHSIMQPVSGVTYDAQHVLGKNEPQARAFNSRPVARRPIDGLDHPDSIVRNANARTKMLQSWVARRESYSKRRPAVLDRSQMLLRTVAVENPTIVAQDNSPSINKATLAGSLRGLIEN